MTQRIESNGSLSVVETTTPDQINVQSGVLSTGGSYIGTGSTVWYQTTNVVTPAGTGIKVESSKKDGRSISPKVYFRFVKSKLVSADVEVLTAKLKKLGKMVVAAKETEQTAMYEALSIQLALVVREQEAAAAGYGKLIRKETVDKFIKLVEGRVIRFDSLDKFPRTIPKAIRTKIQKVKAEEIFDDFQVLYVDYTGEELKTNKQKILDKDPILFGRFSFAPDNLYFIADWIDKYCDITLSSLVETITLDDPEFELESVPDITEEYVAKILKEVSIRHDRLKSTRASNYRDLAAEEDRDTKNNDVKKPTSLVTRFLSLFRKG